MARFDIMPLNSALGGHTDVLSYSIGIGSTATGVTTAWRQGNPVLLDAGVGDINLHADGAVASDNGLLFIAAADSAGIIQMNSLTDPVAAAEFALVPVWSMNSGDEFVATRAYNNTDTALDLDADFQIGDTADIWADNVTTTSIDTIDFGLDINGNGFVITRKLDALGRDSLVSGQTTTRVAFRRLSFTAT